ncbi:hypothetical protein [Raoultella terrigena]|jgi:hypothetical protein|nr:hypothetical protein [Raoultella terrigena]ROS21316.1 hypothetical protein EDF79_3886 [Raoultella terrigena]
MKKPRFTEEQIVFVLKQAELVSADVSAGMQETQWQKIRAVG